VLYTISFDLNQPGQDYPRLYDTIKSLGAWCHPVDSTWFVDTTLDAVTVYKRIATVMDESDKLIVTLAGAPAVWDVAAPEASAWLKELLKLSSLAATPW
jgi:hypothetical protein